MKHKRPPIPVIVMLILAVLVGGYFAIPALFNNDNGYLTASGTIEAVEVTISPEIGGKVIEVPVDEGSHVNPGEILFRLDDTLYQAQRAVAAANLELSNASVATAMAALGTAQANYNLAVNAVRLESVSTRTDDWSSEFGSTTTRSEEIIAALNEVDDGLQGRDKAYENFKSLYSNPESSNFVTAETSLFDAQASFFTAQSVLQSASLSVNNDLRDKTQDSYDKAKTKLDGAQAVYDELINTDPAKVILTARVELAVAQERYDSAQDRLLALQTSEDSPKLAAALAALRQAQAAADQATLAVPQAEASLAFIETQIARLTISAPSGGTILTNSIQPGEIVAPGSAVMSLGRLDNLTITVYIPEDRYGELSLGMNANLTVDSFPDESFNATVIKIANQAEFTPRNVQTSEGRASTVFAIKLRVQDPEGKLKPGMPADVAFPSSPKSE